MESISYRDSLRAPSAQKQIDSLSRGKGADGLVFTIPPQILLLSFPTVATRPLPSYEDKDFTLEIKIPAGMGRDEVMDACIRHTLEIEDTFGCAILIRVKQE